MKPTQEQVIAWAREAGVGKAFVCAKPDECPDDDGCCHQNKQDGYWVRDDKFLAALTLAYEAGRKDENEACAKVCEAEGERSDASWVSCAFAIRERGAP